MSTQFATVAPTEASAASAACSEDQRMAVLASYGLDALSDDPELSAVTAFAARLCDASIALISLVETERQIFLARSGLEARETPRGSSFCAHAMLESEPMVVGDATLDSRFADNPLVTGPPHIRFYAGAPLVSSDGVPLGALCVIDTSPRADGLTPLQKEGLTVLAATVMRRLNHQRRKIEGGAARAVQAKRMRQLGDWLPDIIWAADAEGNFDYFNARWQQVTGKQSPTDTEGWRSFVHPDDQEHAFATWYSCAERGEAFEDEYRLLQADGSWRWTLSRALPLLDRSGRVIRWYGTLTDVDDAHRKLIGRELLSQELTHRIKNIFAVINGLIAIRGREHPDAGEFAEELSATLMALSRAHQYVTLDHEQGKGSLMGLLHELLAPYGDVANDRLEIAGDDFELGRKVATPFALVFHELATNSAKYGAFSVPAGRVEVASRLEDEALVIDWRESGGPPVSRTDQAGFGSRLVELTVSSQLQGKLERDFRPDGLVARLTIPRDRL